MKFETLAPYLPIPVVALKAEYWDKSKANQNRTDLFNTAAAVTGYFLAAKLAERFGFDMTQVALLTTLALSGAARLAIGGHFVVTGVLSSIAAAKAGDGKAFAKFASLAALGYFSNTKGYRDLMVKFYNKL